MEPTLSSAEEAVRVALGSVEDAADAASSRKEEAPAESHRDELIRLAEIGEISRSPSAIRKASQKTIEKIYAEYEKSRMDRANDLLTEMFIAQFADLLGGFEVIDDSKSLRNELSKDELLKSDVKRIVMCFSPYIPLVGILSGVLTTLKHVYVREPETSD